MKYYIIKIAYYILACKLKSKFISVNNQIKILNFNAKKQ